MDRNEDQHPSMAISGMGLRMLQRPYPAPLVIYKIVEAAIGAIAAIHKLFVGDTARTSRCCRPHARRNLVPVARVFASAFILAPVDLLA